MRYILTTLLLLHPLLQYAQIDLTAEAIQKIMSENPVIGLSVAVVKNNKLVYTKAFGSKNKETNEALKTNDIFRIASISKSFSATSILQLVEKGKLHLDDDFGDLIGFPIRNPKFPNTVITLRMALAHLSSINDSQGYFNLDAINPHKNPDWAKCYSDAAPGTKFDYCNFNYNMIGAIIERKSGERFDRYVKKHILDPLDLYGGYCVDSLDKSRFANIYAYHPDSSYFSPSPNAYNPRYEELKDYQLGYSTPGFSPTGGMKISAPDLARYMMMHMNFGKGNKQQIISRTSAKEMRKALSPEEGYGFALENSSNIIPGIQVVGHTGDAYGLFSAMFFDSKKKFGIVVISNGCDPSLDGLYNILLKKVVNAVYETQLKTRTAD